MQQYFIITDNTLLWKVMINCTKYVTEQWANYFRLISAVNCTPSLRKGGMRDNKLEDSARGRGAESEPAVWIGAKRSVTDIDGESE